MLARKIKVLLTRNKHYKSLFLYLYPVEKTVCHISAFHLFNFTYRITSVCEVTIACKTLFRTSGKGS